MTKTTLTTTTLLAGVAAAALLLPSGCSTYNPNAGGGRPTLIGGEPQTTEPPIATIKEAEKPTKSIPPLIREIETEKETEIVLLPPPSHRTTPAPLPADTKFTTYTVKPGDTVTAIANAHGLTRAEFVELNNIADPNKIRTGQKFKVPADGKPLVFGSRPAATPEVPNDGFKYHIVEPGEILGGVAQKHGVKTADLIKWNNITDPDRIVVGQVLRVSDKKDATTARSTQTQATPGAGRKPPQTPEKATVVKDPAPVQNALSVGIVEEAEVVAPLRRPVNVQPVAANKYVTKSPEETIYSITVETGWNIMDLRDANPGISLTDSLPVGTVVNLPEKK